MGTRSPASLTIEKCKLYIWRSIYADVHNPKRHHTLKVFPTSAIKWVQTGEASLAASLQTQNGLFFCCSACFSGSGGDDDDDDDDDESNCCDCCEYEFNDVTKSMKSKSMTIHTTLGTSIPLNWDDQNTALASEKLDCCNPSIQRKSTEVTNYGKFNDFVFLSPPPNKQTNTHPHQLCTPY